MDRQLYYIAGSAAIAMVVGIGIGLLLQPGSSIGNVIADEPVSPDDASTANTPSTDATETEKTADEGNTEHNTADTGSRISYNRSNAFSTQLNISDTSVMRWNFSEKTRHVLEIRSDREFKFVMLNKDRYAAFQESGKIGMSRATTGSDYATEFSQRFDINNKEGGAYYLIFMPRTTAQLHVELFKLANL